jgi:hypothetical protein
MAGRETRHAYRTRYFAGAILAIVFRQAVRSILANATPDDPLV